MLGANGDAGNDDDEDDYGLVSLSGRTTPPAQASHAQLLPTLTPAKGEVHPGYYARFSSLVYGNKADSEIARQAINDVMLRITVKFLSLRLPLIVGAVLLYMVATQWLGSAADETAGPTSDSGSGSGSGTGSGSHMMMMRALAGVWYRAPL